MPTLQQILNDRKRRGAGPGVVTPTIVVDSDTLKAAIKDLLPDILEALQPVAEKAILDHAKELKAVMKGDPGDPGKHAPAIDIDKIVQRVARLIPPPKDGDSPDEEVILARLTARIPVPKELPSVEAPQIDHDVVAKKVVALIKDKKMIGMEHIEGIGKQMENYWKRVMAKSKSPVVGGGGDTVLAGTGINIVRDAFGRRVISSLSAPGTAVYEEVPTDSGDHTNFTLAHAPITGTLRVYRGGNRQQNGVGKDYTYAGTALTLTNALSTGELLIVDYEY